MIRDVTGEIIERSLSKEVGMPMLTLLTVDEAASVLRIGRSLSYQLAAEYEASGGMSGMPVIRIGGCLRVPHWALLELALTGRVVRLCDAELPADTQAFDTSQVRWGG